eukprot:scaffold13997_cov72-Phaeocystis_antarctica.AAC.5
MGLERVRVRVRARVKVTHGLVELHGHVHQRVLLLLLLVARVLRVVVGVVLVVGVVGALLLPRRRQPQPLLVEPRQVALGPQPCRAARLAH